VTDLALLGAPPVLRTEDPKQYEAMFNQFLHCFEPEDFFELMELKKMVDAGWHIKRYTRHKTLTVERWYQQSLEFQVQRLRSQNAKREALARNQAEPVAQGREDIAAVTQLEENALDTVKDVDEILKRVPTEIEHNRALEKSLDIQEKFEKLIISETVRFNKALETFEHYRLVLAPGLRTRAEQIVEQADYTIVDDGVPKIASPSIVTGEKRSK
jgi:hypothetical protein